jgi:hypothetical protein
MKKTILVYDENDFEFFEAFNLFGHLISGINVN